MISLEKTASLVKKELEQDLFLLELLQEDLINVNALSRKLLPAIKRHNPKATPESLYVAIQRYKESCKKEKISSTIAEIISLTQLSTKNDLVHLTFQRNHHLLEAISRISPQISWANEEIFFLNQGSNEVTIIVDEKNERLFTEIKKYIVERTADVALISLLEPANHGLKALHLPGIYSYFISKLSRQGINIIELISTLSQLSFIVECKDLLQAYDELEKSIRHFRRKSHQ